jgi:hypothetical protein
MMIIHINNTDGITRRWLVENDLGHIYEIALKSDRSIVSHISKYDCYPVDGDLATTKVIGTRSSGNIAFAGFCHIKV